MIGKASKPMSEGARQHERILDAAGAAFARNGFHRTTMQDIASEAGMSAGNIYHYFKSKDFVVLALTRRQRNHSDLVGPQLEQEENVLTAWYKIIEEYITTMSRSDAILRIEIIAEASRNAVIAEDIRQGEIEFRIWFNRVFGSLAIDRGIDIDDIFDQISIFMRGTLINCALSSDYNPLKAAAQFSRLLEVLTGAVFVNRGKFA